MADLNITLAFLLDNLPGVAQELERAGGTAGADFGKGLSDGAKKALSDLVSLAEKAAKDVGLVFNRQKFQFETVKGDIVPPEALKNLGKVNDSFKKAQEAVQAFKSALPTSYAIDDRSIAALSNKLAGLKSKQLEINVDSKEFAKVQAEINTVERELNKIASKRVVIDASAGSVLALVTSLQDKLSQLQDKRLRVDVDSKDFQALSKEIAQTEEELRKVERKQVEIDIDSNSLQGLQDKLRELQSKQTKVSVNSEDFVRLQREIDVIQNDLSGAEKARFTVSVDATSLQGLDGKLRDLQNRQAKISVDSSEFTQLQTEIDKVQEEISAVQQKKILLNVDTNSITALTTKLQTDIDKLRQRRVQIDINSTEFKTLSAEISKAERELQQLQQAAGNVGGFNILDGAIQGVAFSLANTLTNGVGAALGSIRNMVGGFLELDGELRLAAAAAGETGGYERLGSVVQKVGIDAAGTSKQVAELATSLVRAGFSVKEVEDALPGVVRGAEATGTGFQQFGDIVGNTLRGFGLDVKETASVVDILTNTANSSNASIEGLGYTFEYTAPIAKALGVSLEDVAAATGLMANAGIQGSTAGTGLREALTKLQQAAGGASPEVLGLSQGQERLQAVMQKLGVSILDTQGKLLPLDQVFLKLKGSLEQLNQGDQVQLANILFGDQAGNKILAITNQSSEVIKKMFSDIRNSSGATDEARNAMSGFGLELQQLQGTVDALGNKVGETFAAALRPLLSIANQVAGGISELPEPVKVVGSLLIGFGAAAAAASIGLAALQIAVDQVGGFGKIKTAVTGTAAAITGPFAASTAIILAIGVAVGLATGQFKNMDATTKQMIATVSALGAGMAVLRGQMIFTGIAAAITRIVQAYRAWTTATNIQTAAQAALTILTGGTAGLGKVAAAAAAAAGTYAILNGVLQESGQATEELSEEQRNLQSEIDATKKTISEQQELGISTDAAEKRLAELESKKASLSEPLALSIEIDEAKKKYEQLSEQAKKTTEGSGKAAAQAQADAAKNWEQFLRAVQSGENLDGFSEPLRKGGEELKSLSDQIFKLVEKQVQLPLSATVERAEIDKQVSALQKQLDEKKARLKIEVDQADIQKQIDAVNKKRFEAIKSGGSKDQITNLDKEAERLVLLQAKNQKELIGAQKEAAAVAKDMVQTEAQKAELIKTQSTETEARLAKQVAAGGKTKSQAEEELRLAKLIALEEEKKLKIKQLAAIPAAQQNNGPALQLRNDIAGIDKSIADTQVQQREAALEKEIGLIGTAKVEYEAYLTQLRAAGQITKNQYENEVRYLERVAMEREKSVKVNQLSGISDKGSKEALALRKEIASLDKGLADNQMATANAAYEKAVQEVDLKKGALDLIAKEIELQQQAADQVKGRYEMELQYAQALLAYAQAKQSLVQSEFDVSKAFNAQALQAAEANLAALRSAPKQDKSAIQSAERQVLEIKKEGARISLQAKQAELQGLREQDAIEQRALELKQRMAVFDQQSRIAQAETNALKQRQVMLDLQVKIKDPNLTGDQKKAIAEQIQLQGRAIGLADSAVNSERERLDVLYEINRVERDTLSMNQAARRNKTYADFVNLGGRYAGGPVDPRFKYTVNELGMESFLSATGTISWIHKPAYGIWSPPTRGIVLPAGITQQLAEAGALPPLPGTAPRRSKGSVTRIEQLSQAVSMNLNQGNMILAMQRQSLELSRLQRSIDALAGKDWNVQVQTPSNAGLLRTLQGF